MAQSNTKLSEPEGRILVLIARKQPITAYQVYKVHEQSPTGSINSSKGTVYPAMARLKKRGLIEGKAGSGARKSEVFTTTKLGIEAAREWTKNIDVSHVNIDDPIKTRVLSFDLLTRTERLEWIARAKAAVKAKQDELIAYERTNVLPYHALVFKSAEDLLRQRMEWLDDLLYHEVATAD